MEFELRKWRLSDAGDLAEALSNKKILNNLRDGIPYPYTERDAAEYISAMLSADENSTFARAITIDDRAVGSIGAFRQGNIHCRTAELGYYLAEPCWGQGIMSRAIGRFCDELFDNTDLLRIYAEPFAYNTGSCRALEKAGFSLEGTMRCGGVKNDKLLDMKLYALTRCVSPCAVRRLTPEQIPAACALAWKGFLRFAAPDCSEEGVGEFRKALDDRERKRRLDFYGAFSGEVLVGVLAMRAEQHISLFFVDEGWHRRGIGRRLFEAMRQDYALQRYTVHASPWAVEVYRHLGFVPTAPEQTENGIRFTPMQFEEERRG